MPNTTKFSHTLTVSKYREAGYPGKIEQCLCPLCPLDTSLPTLTNSEEISRALTATTNESHYNGVCRVFGEMDETLTKDALIGEYTVEHIKFYRHTSWVTVEVLVPNVNLDCATIAHAWLKNAAKVKNAFSQKYPEIKKSGKVIFDMERFQDTIYG